MPAHPAMASAASIVVTANETITFCLIV